MKPASAAGLPALRTSTASPTCQIGIFYVDPSRNLLESEASRVAIEPRVMDVLCTLARRQGEVVTRAELIERHWGEQFGGDESLTRAISLLRKTFRSDDAAEEYIETIPKRGYRLVQPVHDPPLSADNKPAAAAAFAASLPGEATPQPPPSYSVAVVPIRSTARPTEEPLADDIGHDLVEMLSRTPQLRVSAYDASLKDRRAALDVKALGYLLNAHYIVSGSLARSGNRLTLRIELVDAVANRHILSWKLQEDADRFMANLDDFILDLSTPIVSEIQISEASSAHMRQEDGSDAYAVIQSAEMLRTIYNEERALEIIDHLSHLIECEPGNAFAHASLAVQMAQNVVSAWTKTPSDDVAKAKAHISRALSLAPRDPDVQVSAGIVAFMTGEDEKAIDFLTRSLRNNPNNPHALAVLGFAIGVKNGDEAGIAMIRAAEKRAPNHPRYPIWAHYRGSCLLAIGRVEDAVKANREAIDRNPNYHLPQIVLATALILLDRFAEANAALLDALENAPQYSFQDWMDLLEAFPEIYQKRTTKAALVKSCREVWPC